MEWYYAQGGTQHGPVSEAELKNLIANGTLASTDMAWNSSMTDWLPISGIPALAPAAPVAATDSGNPLATSAQTPYQTPSTQNVSSTNAAAAANIPSYLWQSICVALLCCLIGGVVAIVHAAKVDGFKQAGNYDAALEASNKAKTWCLWSFIIGLVINGAYIALVATGALAGSSGY